MPNTANVKFKYTDQTQMVTVPQGGISFVMGPTEYGPIADPSSIITGWPKFQRLFGGLVEGNNFPLLCKKALERGAILRVSRVVHYTDPTDKSTDTTVKASSKPVGRIEFDAPLISLNQFDITIGTSDMDSVTFITNHNKTMEAIVTALNNMVEVSHAAIDQTSIDSGNYLAITVESSGSTLNFSGEEVTLGLSQANVTADSYVDSFINQEGETLFKLTSKHGGAGYNDMEVKITNNLSDGTFSIIATLGDLTETFSGLKATSGTSTSLSFLESLEESLLLKVIYVSTASVTDLVPLNISAIGFKSGTDGTSITNTDYIGDSAAKTGFHAFDQYDDSLQISAPDIDETLSGVHVAGAAYVENRKDLMYYAHLSNSNVSADSIISARGSAIDSKYVQFFAGGVRITDPITGLKRSISEIADILGNCAFTDEEYAPYYSIAGRTRGKFNNVLGIVNNFGAPGSFNDLNLIALAQVNMAVNKSGTNMLSGNFTAQLTDSQTKFANITRGLIWVTKSLKPTLENFLEEPNVPSTWYRMYQTVKPFLDGLLGKFFYDYSWNGDQFVSEVNDDNLQVNTATDVSAGKYKVKFVVQLIPSLQEIEIEVIMTNAGFEFNF